MSIMERLKGAIHVCNRMESGSTLVSRGVDQTTGCAGGVETHSRRECKVDRGRGNSDGHLTSDNELDQECDDLLRLRTELLREFEWSECVKG